MYQFFTYLEILALTVVFLFCYMFILFDYESIEISNLRTAAIEIMIAGTAAYFLAKYFFRKEMNMKNREIHVEHEKANVEIEKINVERQKIENDFQYYLRGTHTTSWMLQVSENKNIETELPKIETWLHRTIESHKVYKPTDMEIRELLEKCDTWVQELLTIRHDEISFKDTLARIVVALSKIGHKYNFDLSIA